MHEYVTTADGAKLFLDIRGDRDAPALLYLHGGPGMGCWEFMEWQGGPLAENLLLIGLDQRGVLRSDPVPPGAKLTERTLTEDCEAVRKALGLERWSVLGHSFGGRTTLRYAREHPDRIQAVIFECPGWDVPGSDRFRLTEVARRYERAGQPGPARRCRELAVHARDGQPDYPRAEILDLIGGLSEPWFLADPANLPRLEEVRPQLPEELQDRGDRHQELLMAQPEFTAPLLPLLAGLRVPALLITGEHDLVTAPEQVAAFRREVPGGEVANFTGAGHFVQLERQADYTAAVTRFVLAHARPTG